MGRTLLDPRARRVDSRAVTVRASVEEAYRPIARIGGPTGWYWGDILWRLRGRVDEALGGVGLRRGRSDPERLTAGDTVDFWRVEAVEPDRRLRLRAEMRLPGTAWLEFEVEPAPDGATVRQTATFDPAGIPGLLYWYGLFPLHALVFRGMLEGIRRRIQETRPPDAEHQDGPPPDLRPLP